MIHEIEDIAVKLRRQGKEFNSEYAKGNYSGAEMIYNKTLEAADFLEINEKDVQLMFGTHPDNRNIRLGVFDTSKVMTAKVQAKKN